jgi:hypothetical protein
MWDLTPPPGETRIPKPVPLMPHMLPAIPTITPISSLNEEKSGGPCRALAFNPKYMVFASAGEAMVSQTKRGRLMWYGTRELRRRLLVVTGILVTGEEGSWGGRWRPDGYQDGSLDQTNDIMETAW